MLELRAELFVFFCDLLWHSLFFPRKYSILCQPNRESASFVSTLPHYLFTACWCNFRQHILGARQAAGLSRSIFLGAVKRTVSMHPHQRAQKGYLRISLARFASSIEKISPAIATAPRVRRACAPGNAPRWHTKSYCQKDQPQKNTYEGLKPS
jgi:hypothetical protein